MSRKPIQGPVKRLTALMRAWRAGEPHPESTGWQLQRDLDEVAKKYGWDGVNR